MAYAQNDSGIYRITCTPTGKIYIGSAVDFKKRFRVHVHHLNNGSHHSAHLQNAWKLHGEAAFLFEIVERVPIVNLIEREQWWIDSQSPDFNMSKVAGSVLGTRRTEAQRKRMSEIQYAIAKRRPSPLIGMKRSEETREKIRTARASQIMPIGRKFTDEHRRNLSVSHIGQTRIFSKEHCLKISASKIGRKRPPTTEKTRAKLSEAMLRHWERKKNG